jgi:hypothetical protein
MFIRGENSIFFHRLKSTKICFSCCETKLFVSAKNSSCLITERTVCYAEEQVIVPGRKQQLFPFC